MEKDISVLQNYWANCSKKTRGETHSPKLSFDEITNSLFGVGDFYFYIVDFYDMSIHQMSSLVSQFHGFDPKETTFNDILGTIHPDDIDFVNRAEAACLEFMFKNLNEQEKLSYKMSYHFRARMKNGTYSLINHQAMLLTLDEFGRYGKSLNIHTNVQHINSCNPYTFSILGLNGQKSYCNLPVPLSPALDLPLSKRELEILRLIAEGLNSEDIGRALFISSLTVKKHRANMLRKAGCSNVSQLVSRSLHAGLI
jgi:DNA-binding CsgD family transcriptional regulator